MIVAGDRAREALRAAGDRPLLFSVDGPARTGSELDRRIDGVAGALVAAGAREAPVGIWMWNSAAAFEAHLAVERVGATRVPVDPSAPPDEMKAVMAATGAHVIVTDRDHAPQVESLVHDDEEPLSDPASVDATTVDPDTTHLLYPRMVADGKLLAVRSRMPTGTRRSTSTSTCIGPAATDLRSQATTLRDRPTTDARNGSHRQLPVPARRVAAGRSAPLRGHSLLDAADRFRRPPPSSYPP